MSVIRKFFGNSDPVVDERAKTQSTVDEANAAIRQARSDVERLKDELATATQKRDTALEQLNLSEPAAKRVREAREADEADRERRVANGTPGTPGADGALAVAIDRAVHDQREAEAAENAARNVLPALETRVAELQEEIHNAELRINDAIWNRRLAELAAELPEVRRAASVVEYFSKRLAALADVGKRGRLYGTPTGNVPEEFGEACEIPKISESEHRSYISAEIDYLKRCKENPEV